MTIATTTTPGVRAAYRGLARDVLRAPATWVLVALSALASVYLIIVGDTGALLVSLATTAGTILFSLLTVPLTLQAPSPAWTVAPSSARTRVALWAQVVVLVLVVALVDTWLLVGHGLMAPLPIVTPALDWLAQLQVAFHIPGAYNALTPLLYFLIPCAALLLLGARLPELGFGRGYHVWRVTLLWCAGPLILLAFSWMSGGWTLQRLIGRAVQTTINSGPFEEFLFRGALLTRVVRLLGAGWGCLFSCLAFASLHIMTDTVSATHGNMLAGCAVALVQQGLGSLGLILVFWRTRNLLAPSLIHIATNVAFG